MYIITIIKHLKILFYRGGGVIFQNIYNIILGILVGRRDSKVMASPNGTVRYSLKDSTVTTNQKILNWEDDI